MKKVLTLLLISLYAGIPGHAQECMGMTLKTGMSFEMTNFNPKDKPTGKMAYQVTKVGKEGASTVVDITVQMQDDKGKQQPPYSVRYTCNGNELVADLSGMMQAMQTSMKDMEVRMKSNKLIYPGKLSVGQTLVDGELEADMSSKGNTMMQMSMKMTNRKVDSKETVTTPAGTFDTYKVSSDMNVENRVMGMPIRSTMHTVSYRADNQLLDIKSETYNKNGKLMGYSLLSKAN
ncbi:hypothetical protein [Spirosoma utsteinense]|uniref:DUF3108 domain-containing protein n=1 Tax=Spirosoma utsteinense TaxID=2585773 RepID=A0ABR6W1N5_9BACT|nr:hypothetical protein [Spirosoma utsteinense]MBC3789013.1 hypothetical protein [Spirosoma utsteinense]MBC3790514.1 hypothetical protein [Spirosoma utsteinense]